MDEQDASENITFPGRYLFVGRSKSGKTTELVKFFCKKRNYSKIDRFIIVCPTFLVQDTYKPLRTNPRIASKISPDDLHTITQKDLFTKIFNSIKSQANTEKQMGRKPKNVVVIVDDLAGESLIHNNRKGNFSNFAVACTHWNTSMFVISQNPMAVDPNFRENCEGILVFQSEGKPNVEWLRNAYESLAMEETDMKGIVRYAWKGGREDKSEWGQHFLFIFAEPRKHTRFFIDFKREIPV